ncbi:MAG TPA: hypothetical protein VG713_08570, partial [Pirellulales bacterium]|nr:hypothetical protein [Pirellulales bacterium]
DLQTALRGGTELALNDLFARTDLPASDGCGVFYGQSLSVVQFLVERSGRATFLEFVKQSLGVGYDHALRDHYQIRNVRELERQWREHAVQSPAGAQSAEIAPTRSRMPASR